MRHVPELGSRLSLGRLQLWALACDLQVEVATDPLSQGIADGLRRRQSSCLVLGFPDDATAFC